MATISDSNANLTKATVTDGEVGKSNETKDDKESRRVFNYPLVKGKSMEDVHNFPVETLTQLTLCRPPIFCCLTYMQYTDMSEELRIETVDMVVTYLEKHPGNYEAAAKSVKEIMDKKFGTSWHVVIGEGFEFEVTYEMKNLLYMYFGTFGVLLWKAS